MDISIKRMAAISLVVFALGLMPAWAAIRIWSGSTGDWSEVANWTTTVPVEGDDVVITNRGAFVLLTNATPWLSSMVISNASLACSNWNTTIYVTNLTILSSGILTCAGPFTNTAMSNRVNVTCTNLFIASNGAINVTGKGFSGGTGNVDYAWGHGPGGSRGYWGASYGGAGMDGDGNLAYGTNTYGSASAPVDPGSGGNAGNVIGSSGGSGGGAVCVTAVQVVVNGNITANGGNYSGGSHNGGGSGGGIYITCSTITGTNGAITVNAGPTPIKSQGGGAGGGRIAVIYDTAAQAALPVPSISFSAASFSSGGNFTYIPGDIGTLYFPDNYFFSPTNLFTGQWLSPVPVSVAVADWTVSNVWTRLSLSSLTVTNTLTVTGTNYLQYKLEITNACAINCGNIMVSSASLVMGARPPTWMAEMEGRSGATSGPTLTCANNLILTNSGQFYVYAGLTNSGTANGYGARVIVSNEIRIATNCWIYPAAHPTNGAVPLFSMRNLTIDSGGGFNADNLGYGGAIRSYVTAGLNPAYGPGATTSWNSGAGSSHGGMGAGPGGGPTYGSSNAPVAPGSGARADSSTVGRSSPYGAGSVQIRATETVSVKGQISADCNKKTAYASIPAYTTYYKGPGSSGGAIYIVCRTFIGDSNAVLQANGDQLDTYVGYGGGGGRIAVWRIFDKSMSVISNYVNGGIGNKAAGTGAPGTIVWGWIVPPAGSIISVY